MNPTRRNFLKAAAASTVFGAPAVHAASKSGSAAIVGDGDHRFEVVHDWPKLPKEYTWQTTHNVAVDEAQNLYVIHEGKSNLWGHPSIFVFDPEGRFLRAFGWEFQGGGHGVEIRKEGSEEFLYVCAYQGVKSFSKMTLKGERVWIKHAPMQSGAYAANEDTQRSATWGRNRFLPTNIAFPPDGGFLLADGYGAFRIHRYDKDANWVSSFGGPGQGKGTFNTPHGICIDSRAGREPRICVCDRANNTLQFFDLDGKYLETVAGFGLPANAETWKDLMVVPELGARVTLLGPTNQVVAHLGADVERVTAASGKSIRANPKQWQQGKFVHPHDACFNAAGDIFVAEWVATGRVTKLKRLS
jgi:hypothetical protein